MFHSQDAAIGKARRGALIRNGGQVFHVDRDKKTNIPYLSPRGWVSEFVEFPIDFDFEYRIYGESSIYLERKNGHLVDISVRDVRKKPWQHVRVEKRADVIKVFLDNEFLYNRTLPKDARFVGYTFYSQPGENLFATGFVGREP